jgi:hypothetical protein
MGIAAGGQINQAVKRDPGTFLWNAAQTKVFNVQILNSMHFRQVTGVPAPTSPISAATYTQHGYPFFSMWEEPTPVKGEFSIVRSVGQIDGVSEPPINPRLVNIGSYQGENQGASNRPAAGRPNVDVGFFNPSGPLSEFRSLEALERAIRAQGQVMF